jgi:UDP-N-acetylmuramate--alanine ligase
MVVEADESDRSFLKLFPTIAVITNIDHEHLENYGGFDDLQQAFVDFANKVPFYGAVVVCLDDENLAAVVPRMTRRVTTYGLESAAADVTAIDVTLGPLSVTATVQRRARSDDSSSARETLGTLSLAVPGRHNLQNALAAVAVGMELGLSFERVAAGLKDFRGADRRFDVRGEPNGILVVDDYGHHPTEIAAVLAAARTFNRRIVVAFQPHRFTRTAALMEAFGPALAAADHIVLTDIYAAGEDPIPGVTIDALAAAVRRSVRAPVDVETHLDDVVAAIVRVAKPGDVVITLGAGSIGTLPERLIAALGDRASSAPTSGGVGTEPSGRVGTEPPGRAGTEPSVRVGTEAPVRGGAEPAASESGGAGAELAPPDGDKS